MTSLYHPAGRLVWDTWTFQRDGKAHLIHLQMRRPGTSLPDNEQCTLGHAISDDLLHWQELPMALRRGQPGSYDDGYIFTGCCVEHQGTNHLFYGSTHHDGTRIVSGMCLATSRDGLTWEKHPANPLFEPDRRWYYTKDDPHAPFAFHNWPDVDCRDLCVVKDPGGAGWLGYVVMRRKGVPQLHSCCIALCRSTDLLRWEVGPPCCTPDRFTCFEVPDVFELDGKWYMTALTGDCYGQRERWSDPNIRHATIVCEAESPLGPFLEVRDNLLLANNGYPFSQGFSARSLLWNGERLTFYTRPEEGLSFGRVSWPVKLVPRPGGGLQPMYWSGQDKAFGPVRSTAPRVLRAEAGWQIEALPEYGTVTSGMIQATVELRTAQAAGIVFNRESSAGFSHGLLALLDAGRGEVALLQLPGFLPLQQRQWPVSRTGPHHLRVIFVDGMVEVYVDDVLILNHFAANVVGGLTGLFIQDGEAAVQNITISMRSTEG